MLVLSSWSSKHASVAAIHTLFAKIGEDRVLPEADCKTCSYLEILSQAGLQDRKSVV